MKKTIYKLILVMIVLFNTGCSEDFLERESLSSLANDNFWTTESDATLGLMGAYSALQSKWIYDSSPYEGGSVRWDFMSDNGYTTWQWMAGGDIAQGIHTAESWMVNDTWKALYVGITRANTVIQKVGEMDATNIDEATAKQIIAEASVIRASLYNILAILWKDVPLITEIQNVTEANVPKSTREKTVAFIISDLESVYEDLPISNDWGRLTRGAALGTLARINLFHAGYGGTYEKAAEYSQEVIDLGVYSLFPDYEDLFEIVNEQNNEVIWSIQFDRLQDNSSSIGGNWWILDYQRVLPDLVQEYYMTDGLPYGESELSDSDDSSILSDNRDPRLSGAIITHGDTFRNWNQSWDNQAYMRKWTNDELDWDQDPFYSSQDFYVIRYAHVLLMRAEALLMSGSYTESDVTGLVDQLRARVGMPLVAAVEGTGLSQEELLDIVKHERRIETPFEGLRYFDLMRWEELEEVYAKYMMEKQDIIDLEYPNVGDRIFDPGKHYKWPIPQSEIDANSSLIQHTEWGG